MFKLTNYSGFKNNGWIFDEPGVRIIVKVRNKLYDPPKYYEICHKNGIHCNNGLTYGEFESIYEVYHFTLYM